MPEDKPISLLLVGYYNHTDESVIRAICQARKWRLSTVRDYRYTASSLERRPSDVVVAQGDAADWCWTDVLGQVQRASAPSPLIVTARTADERLWAEVLNLGGYDVLAQPFDSDEVARVLASAARCGAAPLAMAAGRV